MFKWLRRLLPPSDLDEPTLSPDEAVQALQTLATDALVENVWEGLDAAPYSVRDTVRELVDSEALGVYPRHTAIIWLGYQEGNNGRLIDPELAARVEESIVWAFGFDTNNVLTGGALGVLDGLPDSDREAMALRIFRTLGPESPRRYWLLMKVRTPAFVKEVAESMRDYDVQARPKMVGAFRQFGREDFELLREIWDAEAPGADLFAEALGATGHPEARSLLQPCVDLPDPLGAAAIRALAGLDAAER